MLRWLAWMGMAVAVGCGGSTGSGQDSPSETDSDDTATATSTDTSASGSATSESDTSDTGGPVECGPSQMLCDGECVSVTDDDNCGECGVACPGQLGCSAEFECELYCSPGLQNCPEGRKCTAYLAMPGYCCADANKCVDVIGDKQHGEPCWREDDNDDCAKGLFCLVNAGSVDVGDGFCAAMCDPNDPNSCAGKGVIDAECMVYGDGVLPLCIAPCHPLQDDCLPGNACYLSPHQWSCFPTQPSLSEGEPCPGFNTCESASLCVKGQILDGCNAEACCTPLCDVDGAGAECTGAGEECTPFYAPNSAPAGLENLGVCVQP